MLEQSLQFQEVRKKGESSMIWGKYARQKHPFDRREPIPSQLPLYAPEPLPLSPRPSEKEEKKQERGVWITDI